MPLWLFLAVVCGPRISKRSTCAISRSGNGKAQGCPDTYQYFNTEGAPSNCDRFLLVALWVCFPDHPVPHTDHGDMRRL